MTHVMGRCQWPVCGVTWASRVWGWGHTNLTSWDIWWFMTEMKYYTIPGVTVGHILCAPRLVITFERVYPDLVRSLPLVKCLGQLRSVHGLNNKMYITGFTSSWINVYLWCDNIVCSSHLTTLCNDLHCSELLSMWRGHLWRWSPGWPP